MITAGNMKRRYKEAPEKPNDPRTYAIIGAGMEIHKELGCGFLEAVYHEALKIEFPRKQIPFLHEVDLPVSYKGQLSFALS